MTRQTQLSLFAAVAVKTPRLRTATQILDELNNGQVGYTDGNCGICGGQLTVDSESIQSWARATFTDLDKVGGDRICGPCIRCTDGKPPDTLRLYTIIYREDADFAADSHPLWQHGKAAQLRGYNKKDLSEVLRVLRNPPKCRWFMGVADSGQIHIIPWTPVNNGATAPACRLERVPMTWDPAALTPLMDAVRELVDLGFPKGVIIDCAPTHTHLLKFGLDAWRRNAPILAKWSRSPLLRLVALCTRKVDDDDRS